MNYVILFPDELRAESLGCYGHPVVKTPNIDALAAEGALFEAAYTPHPVCGPARCCIASGWYPHVDGRRTYHPIKAEHPNFFVPLREAGFTTAHAAKDDWFDYPDMPKVFSEMLPFYRRDVTKELNAIPEARYSMLYPPVEDAREPELGDALSTEDAVNFIKRNAHAEKPFCLMVSWLFPHPPYTAPESWYNMYDPDSLPLRGAEWMEGKPDFYSALRRFREMEDKPDSIYRKINAVYLGMISYIDELVGRIVNALKEQGIYDDTTILFCSDHGDYAGDALQLEKWPSEMSDMVTRVPLIIRRPGAPEGLRISTPVQSFDMLPTILDYENVKLDYLQFGVSLKPQIEGEPGDAERAVYTEGGYDTHEPWCFEPVCFYGTPLEFPIPEGTDYYPKVTQQQEEPDTVCRVTMQRYKNWKLVVRTNGQNELYDLEKDPLEMENLYGRPEIERLQTVLEQRMLSWLIHTADVVPITGR
ncbi:MAG: DUF4976 domain-containing protein [Lachnospiraceae bacterium]|nr:DUF4976 domain-containing protein [Lachnospiraceae bacterium]